MIGSKDFFFRLLVHQVALVESIPVSYTHLTHTDVFVRIEKVYATFYSIYIPIIVRQKM